MNQIIKFSSNRVWRTYKGGRQLDIIDGKPSPMDSNFPEDWIGSTIEAINIGRENISEGLTTVINNQGETLTFRDVVNNQLSYFLGSNKESARSTNDIPLVKYLDSATRLHFQAHPTRAFAQQRLNSLRGKTEAYVILETRNDVTDPYIYAGFQRPPSRKELKKWIENQDIESIKQCFDRIPVKAGDVFLIPGGRPHALGEGILMLEIMEPSDLAVRFEFERCGYVIPEQARFMGRDIETALDVFDLSPVPIENIKNEFRCEPKTLNLDDAGNLLEELVGSDKTSCFKIKRATLNQHFERHENDFFIGVVVNGKGSLQVENETTTLNQWDRFFCPAAVQEFQYQSDSGMTILECYPGEPESNTKHTN